MLQVKIKCPHCHKPITVRDKRPKIDIRAFDEAMKAMDNAFATMDKAFKKIFGERK